MKRADEGKASLVDFLRSIKFAPHRDTVRDSYEAETPFAQLEQQVGVTSKYSAEESQLIRSAN